MIHSPSGGVIKKIESLNFFQLGEDEIYLKIIKLFPFGGEGNLIMINHEQSCFL